MNDILDALKAEVTKASLDYFIGAEWNALTRYLGKSALVDDILDGLERWVTVSNERLNKAKHLDGGTIDSDENTIVDLSQPKQLQNLLYLWRNSDDTTDADDEHKLFFTRNKNLVVGLGGPSVINGCLGELNKDNVNAAAT